MNRRKALQNAGALSFGFLTDEFHSSPLWSGGPALAQGVPRGIWKLSPDGIGVAVGSGERELVQHAAQDLAQYLAELTGKQVPVMQELPKQRGTTIVIGAELARKVDPPIFEDRALGKEGFVIKRSGSATSERVIAAGSEPGGTNFGVATMMGMIRRGGGDVLLECLPEFESVPKLSVRGIHLNGWPLRHPWAFRAWSEDDWKRYVDMIWLERANLLLLWPAVETLPIPLLTEDRAYLEDVRRVVDYAQQKRGIDVWIMHSANRIALTDCGEHNPKPRPYWVNGCQKDMNPAVPEQFTRIEQSFDTFYSILNNAAGYVMIDSDPGGWPQSPISDQLKIFQAARDRLDKYHAKGRDAMLVDWMWVGWGRHKFAAAEETVVSHYDWTEKNPDATDLAFMGETIRNFKQGLREPWGLLAGFSPYLDVCRKEGVLGKTISLPYGAIEYEPSFPSTNVSLGPVRGALKTLDSYPEVRGVMGNNQTVFVQLPRTHYLLAGAWDGYFRNLGDRDVLADLAELLHPEQRNLIVECWQQLESTDMEKMESALTRLQALLDGKGLGRPGVLGRKLFPDDSIIARGLAHQLKIRVTRERFLQIHTGKTTSAECAKLVVNYLEALLDWNRETGWEKMMNIGIWRSPLFATDRRFTETLSILKRILGEGSNMTPYRTVSEFFDAVAKPLVAKFGEEPVMVGCIEPLKLAVVQAA
jgi:hypothetical protein